MSLAHIYAELHRQAERTGADRGHTLKGGARIAVRVKDGVTTLTISRKGKKVGATELLTSRRDCNVPIEATRYPEEGQKERTDDAGVVWFYVVYRWKEVNDQ